MAYIVGLNTTAGRDNIAVGSPTGVESITPTGDKPPKRIPETPYHGAVGSVTITRVGVLATVSHTTHGFSTGDVVLIQGAVQPEYNGRKRITRIDANSYSYKAYGTMADTATGTITAYGIHEDELGDNVLY